MDGIGDICLSSHFPVKSLQSGDATLLRHENVNRTRLIGIQGTSPPLKKSLNIPEIPICKNVRWVPLITFATFYPKILSNVDDIDVGNFR